jgi:hypothetical protein
MPVPNRPYTVCLSLGIAFFLVSTLLSDVIARTTIGGEGVGKAISQHIYYATIQPIGTGLLLAPFLLMSWMAASLARRQMMRPGLVLLCVACSVLALIYFVGYQNSQQYMEQRAWTAASLAVGLLAFKSIPVVFLGLVAFLIMRRASRVEP